MDLLPLIDRESELTRLERLWADASAGRARLAILHGPRQVGKTFLLAHLAERARSVGGRVVLATALAGAAVGQQLAALADAARRDLPDEAPLVPERFADWPSALTWMATMASRAPLAVLLDEVPWYIATTRTWPSHLQVFWDDLRRQSRPPALLLVLTGSAVASMRDLIDGSGVLYGRSDDELAIAPFDLPTAARLLPDASAVAVIEAYAACGGYPMHLRAWDPAGSARENLLRLMAAPGGLLAVAGERMLADLPDEGGHRRVLHAIGSGARAHSVIASEVGQRLERPLRVLARADLVRLDRPLGSPDRTPGRYELTDTYLRAWYALCWADLGLIEGGQGPQVLARRWPRWERHLGWVFEEQARAHAVRLAAAGRLPAEAAYGRWWSTAGPQVEIDVLGLAGRRSVVVGEAKWADRSPDQRAVADLRRKTAAAPDPVVDARLVWWGRGRPGAPAPASVEVFSPEDMVRS